MLNLFDPLKLGDLWLPNRVIMAPLTRCRASPGHIPNLLMAKYYAQRAGAGLIISEATVVLPQGIGYPNTPGIWSAEQIEGWKLITKAIHAGGGRIFLQLWHVGRVSHPLYLHDELPVAPSAIAPAGHVNLVRPETSYVVPRALRHEEIPGIIAAFRNGAENAQAAGFDGVEIHGANGYLLDQFLQDSTNHRNDDYGGTLENRARLMFEIVDAAISVWGANRVGLHISPRCDKNDMRDSNPHETFSYIAQESKRRCLAFLCAREYLAADSLGPQLKNDFGGVYIVNENFTQESAEKTIAQGNSDAVAFGRLYIANPDLPRRFALNATLNQPNPGSFFHGNGGEGYTDYPLLPL